MADPVAYLLPASKPAYAKNILLASLRYASAIFCVRKQIVYDFFCVRKAKNTAPGQD